MSIIHQMVKIASGLILMSSFTAASAAQLVVGQVAPLTGIDASQGRGYSAGLQIYFNAVNKAGGVNGHTFVLARRDDGGRPEETLVQTKALLAENKPIILAGYFGSRNIGDVVKAGLLEQERIGLVGYRTSDLAQDATNLYNLRATLKDELNRIAEHLATVGITKLALFYENGPGAAALLAAADDAAGAAKAKIVASAGHDAGTGKVSAAVDAIRKATPQAIIMVASGGPAGAFIEQYRSSGGAAQLFATSGADIEQMSKRIADEQMQGVAIAQVTPSPYNVKNRLSKEFSDLVAKAGPLDAQVSYAMLEGFITAKIIVEAARRQGARVTREGFLAALENFGAADLGGYVVAFRPGVRNGSKFVEMTIISGAGKIRQ